MCFPCKLKHFYDIGDPLVKSFSDSTCRISVLQKRLKLYINENIVTVLSTADLTFEGPDQLAPADDLLAWLRDGAVKIRLASKEPPDEVPISVMTVLKTTVDKSPNHVALGLNSAILS